MKQKKSRSIRLGSNSLIRKVKKALFKNPFDTFLTLFLFSLVYIASTSALNWFIYIADWRVVIDNFNLYIFGSYPLEEQWRPQLWIFLLSSLSITTLFGNHVYYIKKLLPYLWLLIVPLGILLLAGGLWLRPISTSNWGGLVLTLILTLCSASIALPLGILLALGRNSKLRMIHSACRIYIDIMRSIPLIAVLFFGQLLIPLFLPIDFEVSRFTRAVLAFALFAASYVAEDIRGGLQAIPSTQYEAAEALGLSNQQSFRLIALPQALKTALPALTNQAIGLLQNTSLMAILGLVELLGISRSILANPEFIGRYLEVYVWLAAFYWLVCTVLALILQHIENQLKPTN